MGPRVAIVYVSRSFLLSPRLTSMQQYSMYGRTKVLADAEKRGVEAAGGTTDIFQSVPPPSKPLYCSRPRSALIVLFYLTKLPSE